MTAHTPLILLTALVASCTFEVPEHDHLSDAGRDGSASEDGSDGSDGGTGIDGTDGSADGSDGTAASDGDGDGFTAAEGDCNDSDASVYPGALDDRVDGTDQDCDGLDGPDRDGDGFADAAAGGTDCDDGDAATNPSGTDVPGDGIDQDCDGVLAGEDNPATRVHDEIVFDSSNYCQTGIYRLTPWDWDEDGVQDLVVMDGYQTRAYVLRNGGVWQLGWTSPQTFYGPAGSSGYGAGFSEDDYRGLDTLAGDWDEDGRDELVLVGYYLHHYAWRGGLFRRTDALQDAYRHSGSGSIDWYKMGITAYDWDGAAPSEIVIGNYYGLELYGFDGAAVASEGRHWASTGVAALHAADFDGDGDEELLVAATRGSIEGATLSLVEFDSEGSLATLWLDTDSAGHQTNLSVGDVDGDGDLDFLSVGPSGALLYLNDGAGSFALDWLSPEASQFDTAALADVNGDGWLDIILPSELRRFSVFLNDGAGGWTDVDHGYLGQGRAVAAHDFDGDGDLEISFVHFEASTVTPTGRDTCTVTTVSLL